jgi:hypothetical protein
LHRQQCTCNVAQPTRNPLLNRHQLTLVITRSHLTLPYNRHHALISQSRQCTTTRPPAVLSMYSWCWRYSATVPCSTYH